jgi:hypothetical protein
MAAATLITKIGENPAWRGGVEEYYSFAIDIGALTISTQEIETIALTGARTGDPCEVTLESPEAGPVMQGAKVTASNVVSFYVGATVSINPAAYVGYLKIFRRAA